MKRKNSGWRNWGDHPVVVFSGLVVALITILVFVTGKENLSQFQRDLPELLADTTNSTKKGNHPISYDYKVDQLKHYSQLQDSAFKKLNKITYEYDSLNSNPKSSELTIALKKLEMVRAERWFWQTNHYRDEFCSMDDTTKKNQSEIDYDEYISLNLDEDLSTNELKALLVIKRTDYDKLRKMEGEQQIFHLNEKLTKLRNRIKYFEAQYPEFWYKANVQKN